jgi:hypothetical protein
MFKTEIRIILEVVQNNDIFSIVIYYSGNTASS